MIEIIATELNRLIPCNGSRLMGGQVPPVEQNTGTRDEGNAAHWLAQKRFAGEDISIYKNQQSPFDVMFDQMMIDCVNEYYDHIILRLCPHETEKDYTLSGPDWVVNGRADYVGHNAQTVFVDDFKYGWRIVEPVENWTLLAHAFNYCLTHDLQPQTIVFTIHQPRPRHPLGPVRTWEITYAQLTAFWQQMTSVLGNLNDQLQTGPHCKRCKYSSGCPATTLATANALEMVATAQIDNISDEQLSQQLDLLKRAMQIIAEKLDGYESLAAYRLRRGHVIPEYAMQSKKGQTAWKREFNDPEMLLAIFGENIMQQKVRTPTQAGKSKIPQGLINAFTHRPDTEPKLTRISADAKAKMYFQR